MLDLSDLIVIVSFTTILTTASTSVLLLKMRQSLESSICEKITQLLIRVGVLESNNRHD